MYKYTTGDAELCSPPAVPDGSSFNNLGRFANATFRGADTPVEIDSGEVDGAGSNFTLSTNTISFPDATVPNGHMYLYLLIIGQDGFAHPWAGATEQVEYSSTTGYDSRLCIATNVAGQGTGVTCTQSNFNSEVSLGCFCAIIDIPGLPE